MHVFELRERVEKCLPIELGPVCVSVKEAWAVCLLPGYQNHVAAVCGLIIPQLERGAESYWL